MSHQVLSTAQPVKFETVKRFFSPANRYLSPLLISCILLVGQLSYGILRELYADPVGDYHQPRG